MPIEDKVYVPMKGCVKVSCENCVEDHIECPIKAILRGHLIEYYQDSLGHLDTEDWERDKIDFSQWHCSRWQLDETRKKHLSSRFVGTIPSEKITPEEQAKDLPLSLLSAAELQKEIQDMIAYMKKGLKEGTHQAPEGEVESGIACLRWVLTKMKVD